MNAVDSNLAMNAIDHAARMIQASWQEVASIQTAPHIRYKPKLFRDGDQWCALLGDDIQEGVCGFGNSPANAMHAFDKAWCQPIKAAHGIKE